MKSYIDLIEQTFEFPTDELRVENNELHFNDVPLMDIVKKYGTPLKLTYLPKIGEKIQLAKKYFENAMQKYKYKGNYTYCYCTKSSHFQFILEEGLKNDIHLETSSAFDISIIKHLYQKRKIDKNIFIICNGYKRPLYQQYITELLNDGFTNCIPVLDNLKELAEYEKNVNHPFQIGIRVAADEEPNFEFYTSRLGIRYNDITSYYQNHIQGTKVQLKLLHFFINTGIKDTAYYWSELSRFIYKYCELKKVCPELDTIDIGGGFPIKSSLQFEYDFQYMVDQIIENIKWICDKNDTPVPHIMTEFGTFTVGESGATIYSVLGQKLQNDKELWYMIDGSFITHLPDIWGVNQKYILLPLNKWSNHFHKVNLGGLTCDSMDYYNSEAHSSEVFLPKRDHEEDELFIGFFHTGAYQESLGGYGGIQHCLIPSPKHVIIDRDENGKIHSWLFSEEQHSESMLKTLGYQ
ncbi:arginine decarboxylase [Xanthovirga aplysinae]|uniref:arginine decarboxylase n=1 Tax=Xanthovirga aplysinae TaxID=2529853 RepID=UPI0012BCFBDE|nr:arginine decarboxylase [Xanthovirga aplysinae]MTI33083.1 arginine decarboxylase [Xanthovirga aplysinae]